MVNQIRHRLQDRSGFTLVEVLLVTIIVGIMAGIIVPNLSSAAQVAKVKAFAGSLATVQSAGDQFYAMTSVYPTYAGGTVANQPVAGTGAAEIDVTAQDLNARALYPGYVRMNLETNPASFNLDGADGDTVYWGITASGKTFATQVAPTTGQWADGTIAVYVQESVQNVDADGRPGSVTLDTLW